LTNGGRGYFALRTGRVRERDEVSNKWSSVVVATLSVDVGYEVFEVHLVKSVDEKFLLFVSNMF
jgi:hypothetical protein